MITINSKRKYWIAYPVADDAFTGKFSIEDIMQSDEQGEQVEHIYAMQDHIDQILDLRIGESFLMNFNRDDSDSEGIIRRFS